MEQAGGESVFATDRGEAVDLDLTPTARSTYILVAPIIGRAVEESRTDRGLQGVQTMSTRLDYDAGDLTQEVWGRVPAHSDADVTVGELEIRTVGGRAFGVGVATVRDGAASDTPTLERHLTEVMTAALARSGFGGGAPWVSRTWVTTRDGFRADDAWLSRGSRVDTFDLVTSDDHTIEVHAGWGNCVLVSDHPIPAVDTREITSGMIDAQLIWGQMLDLADASAAAVRRQPESAREAVDDARRMSRRLAEDNLYYDEVLLRLQGNRVDMCAGLLTAWRYADALERLTRRVDEINSLAVYAMDTRMRKYQNLVEGILFVIGVSGVVQLVLAFVQTAYSGGTAAVPGETDHFSLLRWLRHTDIEVTIWIPTVLSVVLVAYILIVKRKDLQK